jgi:hypothetical protein
MTRPPVPFSNFQKRQSKSNGAESAPLETVACMTANRALYSIAIRLFSFFD